MPDFTYIVSRPSRADLPLRVPQYRPDPPYRSSLNHFARMTVPRFFPWNSSVVRTRPSSIISLVLTDTLKSRSNLSTAKVTMDSNGYCIPYSVDHNDHLAWGPSNHGPVHPLQCLLICGITTVNVQSPVADRMARNSHSFQKIEQVSILV